MARPRRIDAKLVAKTRKVIARTNWLPFVVGALLAVCAPGRAAERLTASNLPPSQTRELLKNGGFEVRDMNSPDYWWWPNNWAKNDVEFALDTDHPHSGKYCQRITLKHIKGASTLEFSTPLLPVKPGMRLRLSFWLRGKGGLAPIETTLRKGGMPYTNYWTALMEATPDWQEHSFTFILPGNTDPADTRLLFNLQDESTIWLDDVSLTVLSESAAASPPLRGNLVANGSFEAGTDRWYCEFREKWLPNYGNMDIAVEKNINANIVSVAAPDAPDGHRVLQFPVFDKCVANLTSAYFPMRFGVPAVISFQMKTSVPHCPFSVVLGGGDYLSPAQGKGFTSADTQWHAYVFPVTPAPTSTGTYFLEFSCKTPAEYKLASVCVNEGGRPLSAAAARRFNAGIEPADDSHPANIFYPGETANFRVRVEGDRPRTGQVNFRGRVVDAWERAVANFDVSVPLGQDGEGQATFQVPTRLYGGFKCELRRPGVAPGDVPDAETIYTVVPKLPAPDQVQDSFFGMHVVLTPYNLLIAQRAGARWLRMHPPLATKWRVVESRKGEYTFFTAGVARAHAMGFKILGSLDSTPSFYGTPQLAADPRHYDGGNSLPGNWDAWRRYVVATVKAFAPYIDHWEVWNEPDSHIFLALRPELKNNAIVKIIHETRLAVDEAHLNVPLLGPTFSSIYGATPGVNFRTVVDHSVADLNDISFHLYADSVEEVKPPIADDLAFIRSLKNHEGQVPGIWVTESGIGQCNVWQKTGGVPDTALGGVLDAAGSLVRSFVAFKALGVKHCFQYAAYTGPAGGLISRHECNSIIDLKGLPHPGLVAYATMVRFLDQARPAGLKIRKVGDASVVIASFTERAKRIAVAWSRVPISVAAASAVLPVGARMFDMMGNPFQASDSPHLTLNPVYFVR